MKTKNLELIAKINIFRRSICLELIAKINMQKIHNYKYCLSILKVSSKKNRIDIQENELYENNLLTNIFKMIIKIL